MFLVTICS